MEAEGFFDKGSRTKTFLWGTKNTKFNGGNNLDLDFGKPIKSSNNNKNGYGSLKLWQQR